MAVNADGAVAASEPGSLDGQPDPRAELIQLLTPEGERAEHPDYPLDLTADEIKALYRDLVMVRRIDFEAIALQRQGELGIWASLLGQEAAQVGSGRALARATWPSPPTASTASPGAGPGPGQAAGAVPRRQPRRLGSRRRTTSTSTRS